MITKYPDIECYRGCTTMFDLDFSKFDFGGGKIVLTIRDAGFVFEKAFDTPEEVTVVLDDRMTMRLTSSAKYDLMWHVDGHRYPLCETSNIIVHPTVGGLR